LATACAGAASTSTSGVADPVASVNPVPNYLNECAPAGLDDTPPCLQMALAAIDAARAKEGLGPMVLPSSFVRLTVPEQLFVAVDTERLDRGLAPFVGLSVSLDSTAATGARRAEAPPAPPAEEGYRTVSTDWIGGIANGLDADFQWLYADGPGSGLPDCSSIGGPGCWYDRHTVLDRFGTGSLVMGAGLDPTGDTSPGDKGGASLAAVFAATSHTGTYLYTWREAVAAEGHGLLRPLRSLPADESPTGIADPRHNVAPDPDYTRLCQPGGVDDSPACLDGVLAAVNHARALEGVRPMVLPPGYASLSVPDQIFVAVNLERVDRGLPPFVGLTAALDANAAAGAAKANDPPDPGSNYTLVDGEWAGGSSNGLDAVYGWMYDDGLDSGNLECERAGASGCWGHRKGILDDFGSGPDLVMGAAIDPTGDTNPGDRGGTSMAATLAVDDRRPGPLVYTWPPAGERAVLGTPGP